jgi:hypothetical protein
MEDNKARSMPVEQKIINPPSGILVLVILIFLCLMVPVLFISGATAWRGGGIRIMLAIILSIVLPFLFGGLRSVRPNEALVLTLFGKYYGTIVRPGYFFVNPFARYNNPAYDAQAAAALATETADTSSRKSTKTGANRVKKTVSLKSSTLDNGTQKVNDALGKVEVQNRCLGHSRSLWRHKCRYTREESNHNEERQHATHDYRQQCRQENLAE